MRFLFSFLVIIAFSLNLNAQQAATVRGEVLLQLEKKALPGDPEKEVNAQLGILPQFRLKECVSDYMNIWLYSFNEDAIDKNELIRFLNRTPGVVVSQANHIIESRLVPNDPFFGQQWHHVQSGDHDIDTDLAWETTTGGLTATGDEIVVCVVEPNGAKWDHPDLIDNHWVNINEIPNNGIDDDANGYVDDYDGWVVANNNDNLSTGNHGTQVSSMIGSRGNNSTGVTGVNWNVKLMQVQIANVSEAGVIAAYNYPLKMRKLYNQTNGAKGAFVVATNSSWGTDGGQPSSAPLWCNMYDSLGTYGVISVASTANNNVNVDVVGDLPTACPSDYLISVTATDNNDQRTFSGYGITTIDLGAPGDAVYLAGASNYGNATGTSFASPCVAGAVGLLYSAPCTSLMQIAYASPSQAALNIVQYILDGVDPVASLATKLVTGGRMNVKTSLDLLMESCAAGGCVEPFAVAATQVEGTLNYLISWSSVNENVNYAIRYRIAGTTTWTIVSNISSTNTLIGPLTACSNYELQVQSLCGASETSDWSATFNFASEGCCVNPDVYTLISQGTTDAAISWNDVYAANSYTMLVTPDGGPSYTISDIENNSYSFNNLIPCTDYIIAVSSVCPNPELASTEFDFNTAGCGSCDDLDYCESGADASLEHIKKVVLGNINRTSGSDGGYIKVEDQTTTLVGGQSYDITCQPGYSGAFSYSEYFKVWIDYNADGVFNNNTELVFDPGNSTTQSITGNFTVPAGVADGIVRMRVAMSYLSPFGGNAPSMCGDNGEGETEDYCVTLDNPLNIAEQTQFNVSIFPNPVDEYLTIKTSSRNSDLLIYDNTGKLMLSKKITDFTDIADVSEFSAGIYNLRLSGENGETTSLRFVVK